jgi:hypothetical protein
LMMLEITKETNNIYISYNPIWYKFGKYVSFLSLVILIVLLVSVIWIINIRPLSRFGILLSKDIYLFKDTIWFFLKLKYKKFKNEQK